MGRPVILTPQSQDDLREIVSYIARDSPERARAFGNLLVDTALSLGEQSERGRIVPEQEDPAVREIVRGAYRIIYEVVREPGGYLRTAGLARSSRHARGAKGLTMRCSQPLAGVRSRFP